MPKRIMRRAVRARLREVAISEARGALRSSASYTPSRRVSQREARGRADQVRWDEPFLAGWREWAGIGLNRL